RLQSSSTARSNEAAPRLGRGGPAGNANEAHEGSRASISELINPWSFGQRYSSAGHSRMLSKASRRVHNQRRGPAMKSPKGDWQRPREAKRRGKANRGSLG